MSGTLVSPQLRHLTAADRGRLEEITRAAGLFRPDEILVALEVFDEAVRNGPGNTYQILGADVEGRLAGWICWGATPCTLGTFDLYWMAVDPALQGSGIGTALLVEMEHRLDRVARLIVVETAGRDDYEPTRSFYQARGYREVARVPDFYAPGEDQVVFVKSVSGTSTSAKTPLAPHR
ncbi:MAG TPA: GNAT family N-acetyltransferase [Gemmatimonadales bacterium]